MIKQSLLKLLCVYSTNDRINQNVIGVGIFTGSGSGWYIHSIYDLSSENLELLVLEISRLWSRLFLVSTWYGPPDSPVSVFNDFEEVVMK